MEFRYDKKVDAAYISFNKEIVNVTTIRLTEDSAIDFGPKEEIVGIEALDASTQLSMYLKNLFFL